MRFSQITVWLLSLVLLGLLGSCSGTSSAINPADQANAGAADTSIPADNASAGQLPSIPLDDDLRVSSDLADPPPERSVVLGSEFIQQWSGEVQETALLLDPAIGGGEENDRRVAFGLYQVAGVQGFRPLLMNVEAMPGSPRQEYFVGVADYTTGAWDWFGPSSLPELQIDLRDRRSRYVTGMGNMYFLVVVHGANTALHSKTTVTLGPLDGRERPGCPVALRASDGELPDAVKVEWRAGEGAQRFELFRASERSDSGRPEWVSLGSTSEVHFLDSRVEPGQRYLYKVRALNANGESCFSNADVGFAGRPDDPNRPQGRILGRIVKAGTDEGVAGVHMTLLGAPGPGPLTTRTGERGGYEFHGLPGGHYIVFAQSPDLRFEPMFQHVELTRETPEARAGFQAHRDLATHLVWGFTLAPGGPDQPGLRPVGGAMVAIFQPNSDRSFTVESGPGGFWAAREIPVGEYLVTAAKEGLEFRPTEHHVMVDGVHMTPARVFFASPEGSGGPDGGS